MGDLKLLLVIYVILTSGVIFTKINEVEDLARKIKEKETIMRTNNDKIRSVIEDNIKFLDNTKTKLTNINFYPIYLLITIICGLILFIKYVVNSNNNNRLYKKMINDNNKAIKQINKYKSKLSVMSLEERNRLIATIEKINNDLGLINDKIHAFNQTVEDLRCRKDEVADEVGKEINGQKKIICDKIIRTAERAINAAFTTSKNFINITTKHYKKKSFKAGSKRNSNVLTVLSLLATISIEMSSVHPTLMDDIEIFRQSALELNIKIENLDIITDLGEKRVKVERFYLADE